MEMGMQNFQKMEFENDLINFAKSSLLGRIKWWRNLALVEISPRETVMRFTTGVNSLFTLM